MAIAAPEPKRRVLLDRGVEDRAVVMVDGSPQRLILDRPDASGEAARGWLSGEAAVARVAKLDRGLGMAFLDTGGEPGLITPVGPLREGQRISGRVTAPARAGKHAVFAADPGMVAADAPLGRGRRPDVAERARIEAAGESLGGGPEAREACDAAEAEALQTEHGLAGGARVFVEPTRALIAVDVDVGSSAMSGDARRRQSQANLAALRELPRLLRLKGLGGIVAVDLAGKGHDGAALAAVAKAAFARVYGSDAAIGPLSRFGVLQLRLPWVDTPVAELLLGADGAPTSMTRAFALLRAMEREAGPGGRVDARCAPQVYAAAAPYLARLAGAIGARFMLTPDPATPAGSPTVRPA